MNKISSIIIARDEEKNIGNCIQSQIDAIDEIIVLVDSKSTDLTLEIVRSFPQVTVEVIDWMGFAKTKQYGVDRAKHDWILWIDADEVITSQLSNELNFFKQSAPEHAAYELARRAYFLGKWIKHSGWYPGFITRLFNKNKARFNDKTVHENLEIDGTIGRLKYDLEHYTDPDIDHYFLKFNKYTSLAAEELFKKKRTAGLNDLLLRPLFQFFKMYVLRRGFLDGIHGFILAVFSSAYVFTKYSKLWELNRTDKK
ncbi:MAG: glycosyl transferase [Melioribacteraceae bacterium]|nr:MAG: glycosyl transferase [Melioribacteraceae bacterium]